MGKIQQFLSHLFIPKSDNNYRSKALHPDFLTYYLVFALILTFTFKNFGGPLSNVLGLATDITSQKLFELINQKRVTGGLRPLTYNDNLAKAAEAKARDMFTKNYWAHFAPDGKSPWDFILGSNYQYEYAGENLAKNFLFSQGVVDAWMNSASHRDNILRPQYSEVGYAIVNGVLNGEETTLVVQMSAAPLSGLVVKNSPAPSENRAVVQKEDTNVLAKQEDKPRLSIPRLSLNLNVLFMLFLGFALLMDFYFAAKSNIIRVSGKHVAHLIFLGFLFAGLLFLVRGTII